MISISLRKLLTTRFRFELCKKETESEEDSVSVYLSIKV